MPVVRQAFIFKSFYLLSTKCVSISIFIIKPGWSGFCTFANKIFYLEHFFLYNFDLNYVRDIIMITKNRVHLYWLLVVNLNWRYPRDTLLISSYKYPTLIIFSKAVYNENENT